MSRDLTCNESLTAEDGTGNNFSPNQSRFNQTQQLFSANSAQSLALIREQLLQQQQLQSQQSNQLAASLLRAQALGTNIDTLSSSLSQANPTSMADNSSLIAQLQLLQQQQNQHQRQAQISALLNAQSNLYGGSQLSSNASALNSLGLSSSTSNDQQTRLNNIQQLASALGLQVPGATQGVGVQNDYENAINQLLHQAQSPQIQNPQSIIANAQALQQSSLSQTATRTSSAEQQLLSRLLSSARTPNISGNNNAQLLLQQQLAEILQSPQLLQVARELTEQHQHSSPQSQQNQFQKQELRQTASYSDPSQSRQNEAVQQYLQRVAAQCGVSLSDSQFASPQATSQSAQLPTVPASIHQTSLASQIQQHLSGHAQQSFVSQANSLLNNLQSAYMLHEAQTPQQQTLQFDQQLSQPNTSRASGTSPRILKRSRPSSSTPNTATTNSLSASQQRLVADYTIEELKQKQSDLFKNTFEGASQQQDYIVEEYRRLQRLIDAKALQQSNERNGNYQNERARLNDEQFMQDKSANSYQQSNTHLNPSDPRFITNIPTLAAFRQVPGQDIFEHMPKKRIKQDKQLDKNAMSLGVQRKQAKSAEALQTKKSPQKSAYMSKKFQNGSNNYVNQQFLRDETITLDEDFENYGQRQANSSNLPRKRGRPRTTIHERATGLKQNLSAENKSSPTRTILHDAVDIFLKPALPNSNLDRSAESPVTVPRKRISRKSKENEQLLSKINSLAAAVAVSMASPQDSDLLSPSDRLSSSEKETPRSKKEKTKFNVKSAETQQSIKEFREKHPEMGELTDLEVCGLQAIMDSINSQHNADPVRAQKNKAIVEKFVATSLQNGPNFWNILHRIPKKMLPNELQIVDHVFNQQHLLDLAKIEMLTDYVKNKPNSSRPRPLFRDWVDANERKNIQSMAMHLSFVSRRMDFVKDFIYESTMVRFLNDEYKQLRGDSYPRELFIDEPAVYNRINKQYGQVPPESTKFLNNAEVECKLLNQMYRYRSEFFNEVHKRPFALGPQKRLTPDPLIIQNMDISKTLFNVVESVSAEKPYVSFEQETQAFLNNIYPTAEDHQRLAFKTGEHTESERTIHNPNSTRTVILKAKQTTNEIDELKQRLQSHLNTNFNELLKLHDTVYKIRCQAIELHKDDINHLITSVQSSIKCGRRSASVEPPMLSTSTVPLYNRRRSRSLDTGARSRVVNSVGVRYVQYPSLSDPTYVELMQSLEKEPIKNEETKAVGPKEYHELWKVDGFATLAERFTALLNERQHLIAALIKLTLTDQDSRAIIEAACEKNVAVDTPTFKVQGPSSRKHRIKSGISVAHHIRKLPHLHRLQLSRRLKKQRARAKLSRFKNNDFNWWYTQMLNGNFEDTITNGTSANNQRTTHNEKQRLKERNKFMAMCKRMHADGIIPYSPSLYARDKNFIIETLSERAFNVELNFRHLKCLALKFYACLDPERHAQFVQKLEKLEAPRLDVVLKMRNDLTIGYLYELPTYELRSHAPQRHKGSSTIKVTPGPDSLDHLFGGKTKNPYRQSLLFPVTTSQFEINSAQLTKYRSREQDITPAERLNNHMNLTDCARALIRLIYQSPKYGNELAIFMSHPAFKILENEQGDSNGLPSTVYQVAVTKAVEQKKLPIEKRKMPEFKTNEEAEQYFKKREKATKEKLASVLTTAHKHTVLGRRCVKTMKKLCGVEKIQGSKMSIVGQHFSSLSNRSKSQFAKRYRIEKFNEATQFESDVRPEDNLKAPLVVPGFNPSDAKPESSLKLPGYVRNDIISEPKVPLSTTDDLRSSMRGSKVNRGRGGKRYRRAAKY